VQYLNVATGTISDTLSYDGWGNIASESNASFGDRYKYTGREYDSATGLQYNRDRYYDPASGRWLTQDPLGFDAGDSNLYRYVKNHPTNGTDPSGLWFGLDDLLFTAGGALVGVGSQLIHDALTGEPLTAANYISAAAGGAVGGEALLYTGPVGAGAAGGAVTNAVRQGINIYNGDQQGFDVVGLGLETATGAALGKVIKGPRLPGITSGRNNYNALYRTMVTNANSGRWGRISSTTACKVFIGRTVDTGLYPSGVVNPFANDLFDQLRRPPDLSLDYLLNLGKPPRFNPTQGVQQPPYQTLGPDQPSQRLPDDFNPEPGGLVVVPTIPTVIRPNDPRK
jgi:RHS repeat-associated protein